MKSDTTDLLWPRFCMVNDPTLLRRITSGMEGNTTTASSWSRRGSTTFWTSSASSYFVLYVIREVMRSESRRNPSVRRC